MLETILDLVKLHPAISSGVGIGSLVLAKIIPNNEIQKYVGGAMYGLGVTITFGLSKWKWSKWLWNKTIEPFFVDLINNVLVHGLQEFIKGMRSDNV